MVDFACLYERFDPAVALQANDPEYVDWQQAVGLIDVKTQLTNSVRLARRSSTHRLFTGLRGGGKTTELRRLQQALRDLPAGERYFVSFLDADDTLDLDDADPTDIVLSVVRQLVSDLRDEQVPVQVGGRLRGFLEAARDILRDVPDAGVDLEVSDPAGIVELSTLLKRQPSARRQIRQLLEGRLTTLYDALNLELLPAIKAQLSNRGYAGVLVLVDQLDRIPPEDERHRAVFWEGRGKLRALDCHILYTAPIEYAYSRAAPTLENEYNELLGLPLIPVTSHEADVRDRALQATRDVALARMTRCRTTEPQLFDSSEVLNLLTRLSGGHLRSLFLLIRTAIERSNLTAPLTYEHVERVVTGTAARYLDPLEGPERDVVRLVHSTRSRPPDEAQLELFYGLLRDQYIFAYSVEGQRWYDWNPLLERSALAES